jgi:hypothetical protein
VTRMRTDGLFFVAGTFRSSEACYGHLNRSFTVCNYGVLHSLFGDIPRWADMLRSRTMGTRFNVLFYDKETSIHSNCLIDITAMCLAARVQRLDELLQAELCGCRRYLSLSLVPQDTVEEEPQMINKLLFA